MNKVYQINIIQDDNGFNVQSPTIGQIMTQDEQGVQDAVKELVTKLLTKKEEKPKVQTIRRFDNEGKEITNDDK